MTPRTTAIILEDLRKHLGYECMELGEMLTDVAYGADLMNSHTKALVAELFASLPHPDDELTFQDIVDGIRHVGTEYAVAVANDMVAAEPIDL